MQNQKVILWIAIGGIYSLINSVFQVLLTHTLSYISPFHMLSAVSIALGMGIVCMGGGALFSRRALSRIRPVTCSLALLIPLSFLLYFWFADFFAPGSRSLIFFQHPSFLVLMGSAMAIAAPPFILMGTISGACFITVLQEKKQSVRWLIAIAAFSFLIGYLGSSLLIQQIGLVGLVIAISLLALLPAIPLRRWGIVILIAMAALFADQNDFLFQYLQKQPQLWNQPATPPQQLTGSWSPYARVDFYQTAPQTLAGAYNGVQQWMVTTNPQENFAIREEGYKFFQGDTLVIGAGGGNGVQALSQAQSITAVELDPVVVRALSGKLSRFNNHIYQQPHVTILAGDGRAFLEESEKKFDAIIIEGADINISANKGTLISMENYLYTTEGLRAAMNRLKKEGALYIFFSVHPTIIQKVMASFDKDIARKFFRGQTKKPINFFYSLLIASRSPKQLNSFPNFLTSIGLQIEERNLEADNSTEVRPVTDNFPFLYITSTGQIVALSYLLAAIGILVAFLILFSEKKGLSLFFAVIGAAFVIAELLLINTTRALLGGFLETAAAVVGFTSLAYALGNILSVRLNMGWITLATITSFGLLIALLLQGLPTGGLFLKLGWILTVTFPVGFSMGLFFPKGMMLATPERAGWYFAIDTMGTAFGSIAFYIVIVSGGLFSAAIMTFAAYLLAAGLLFQAIRSA